MILPVKGISLTRYFTLVNFTPNLSLGVLGFGFQKSMLYLIFAFIFVYQSFKKCRISIITLGTLMFVYRGIWILDETSFFLKKIIAQIILLRWAKYQQFCLSYIESNLRRKRNMHLLPDRTNKQIIRRLICPVAFESW